MLKILSGCVTKSWADLSTSQNTNKVAVNLNLKMPCSKTSTIFNLTFSSGHTSLTANQLKLQKSLSSPLSFQKCSQETKCFLCPPSVMLTGPRGVQVQTTSPLHTKPCCAGYASPVFYRILHKALQVDKHKCSAAHGVRCTLAVN